MLGQRVNNFEIVRLLGQGGMGAVYEAEHRVIRRKVAVKVLKPELAMDSELVQRFFNEARATSAIQHPNIVEVIDLGVLADGVPYLVMELLEGESLADRIARLTRLDSAAVVDFACQTAGALEAAHANGIVHRDLKPDNLFLVRDERFADRELVKVLDFGIAKLRGDPSDSAVTTVAGTIWGTPPYMSPEQCRGLPAQLDHRTDIYALGVIVYEALCGRPPFLAEGLGDVMMMHMGTEPEPVSKHVPNIAPHIERAVHKALAKRPEDRFSSMTEFSAALKTSTAPIVALPKVAQLEARRSSASPVASVGVSGSPLGTFGTVPARWSAAPNLVASDPNAAPNEDPTHKQFRVPPSEVKVLPTPLATPVASADTQMQSSLPAPVAAGAVESAGADTIGRRRASRRRSLALIGGALAGLAVLVIVPWLRRSSQPVIHVGQPPAAPLTPSALPPPIAAQPAASDPEHAATLAAAHKLEVAAPTAKPVVQASEPRAASKAQRAHHPSPGRQTAVPAAPVETAKIASKPAEPSIATSETARAPAPPGAALEPGFLSLDSEPWANVSLNGKALGSTPLMHVALPPGKHVLTLTNPELGISTSYAVEIKSGVLLSRLVGWRK